MLAWLLRLEMGKWILAHKLVTLRIHIDKLIILSTDETLTSNGLIEQLLARLS